VRQVAFFELPAPAEEVAVVFAAAAFGFGVDEATDAPGLVTAVAAQRAFEVVLQHALPGLDGRAAVEHILNAVEQGLADNRLVAAVIEFAVVVDESGVVRVSQDAAQRVLGDRA
jgi:CheY-like chemotaxis protein